MGEFFARKPCSERTIPGISVADSRSWIPARTAFFDGLGTLETTLSMIFLIPRNHSWYISGAFDFSAGTKYITGREERAPIEKRAGFSARSRVLQAAEDFGESGLDALWNVA